MAATTHNARRRQRVARRTTASRAHRGTTARQNRATVAPARAPEMSPVAQIVMAEAEPVKAPAPKVIRTPDADDHLAAYFRQLAEHDLLTPEDERELSQGIEDTEIMTWERVFARPEVVRPLLDLVEPNLEQPVKFPKLVKLAEDMLKTKKSRTDGKNLKKLAAAAKEAAAQLRGLDLDRVHIDAVVRELEREVAQPTWFDCESAHGYLDQLRQAYRDAANLPRFKGILKAVEEPLVSIDYKGDPYSSSVDLPLTLMLGKEKGTFGKIVAWYDNEWGYSVRTADLAAKIAQSL